jgi:hypothetical protein
MNQEELRKGRGKEEWANLHLFSNAAGLRSDYYAEVAVDPG